MCRRLGINQFTLDIAATIKNRVCPYYLGPGSTIAKNALALGVRWKRDDPVYHPNGWSWLNPPFEHIAPWVKRASKESSRYHARIAMLVPAAVGANWWRDHVHNEAIVLFLNGRVTFVGETHGYPKDCAILLYGHGLRPGYDCWQWNPKK